jgi:ribosomal-protein-alanine N-acetyltransferase
MNEGAAFNRMSVSTSGFLEIRCSRHPQSEWLTGVTMEAGTTAPNRDLPPDHGQIRAKKIIFTERLVLRPLHQIDASALFDACTSDPEVTRYLTWAAHRDVSETIEYIKQCQENSGQSGFVWVVSARESGALIGVVECRIQDDAAAFGYLFGRAWWGRGYAKEAVGAVAGWVETIPQVRVLWAYCDTANAASKRLLGNLGFQFYCVMPEKIICPALSEGEREAHCYTRETRRQAMPQQVLRATASGAGPEY